MGPGWERTLVHYFSATVLWHDRYLLCRGPGALVLHYGFSDVSNNSSSWELVHAWCTIPSRQYCTISRKYPRTEFVLSKIRETKRGYMLFKLEVTIDHILKATLKPCRRVKMNVSLSFTQVRTGTLAIA